MNKLSKGICTLAALATTLSLMGCPASGTDAPGGNGGKPGPSQNQQSEMDRKLNDPSTPEAVKAQIRKGMGK